MMYLLIANVSLLLFFGMYMVFLKPLTFFQWNRVYLISAVILSFLMPLFQIVDLSAHKEAYEPLRVLNFTEIEPIVLSGPSMAKQGQGVAIDWVMLTYSIGAMVMFLWFLGRLCGLALLWKRRKVSNRSFSFFNRIVIGKEVSNPSLVYAHEQVHIRQGHSYDILLLELVRVFNWFNPVLYFYLREIKLQHECIADEQCATNKVAYAELLVANALRIPQEVLVHEFSNYSLLKNRIKMLFKNKSKRVNRIKYMAIVPMSFLLGGIALGYNGSLKDAVRAGLENRADLYFEEGSNDLRFSIPTQIDTIMSFSELEVQPGPKGGMDSFRQWVSQRYAYPQEAIDAGVKGRIEVSFVVEKDGSLSSFATVKDIGYKTADALIEVLKKADKWIPGIHNGKKVRVSYTLPLTLNLEPGHGDEPAVPAKITLREGNSQLHNGEQDLSEVNVAPDPVGGVATFRRWVQENYNYPQEAIDAGVKGRMEVSFTIEEDGSLSSFEKVKDLGDGTTDELIALLKKSDKWRPAIIAGKRVKSTYTFPLSINLEQ